MAHLLQSGDSFFPAPSKESLLEGLPVGNYTVEENMSGMYFSRGERFQKIGKLYGDHAKWAGRILDTFQERDQNTGILLSGLKGSGKSLLGRLLSQNAAELAMPTILINKPWPGDKLGPLLSQLTSPAVIFMDEFEKVYNDLKVQESVLSLLDGTASSKHLFILTINESHRLNSHLKNRPGRLYYSIDFSGLDDDFIREYCNDKLQNKIHVEAVVKLCSLFDEFNFDMLKALVEEMNRYGEAPSEAVKLLNITPAENVNNYAVGIIDPSGKKRDTSMEWYGNPLFLVSWDLEVSPEDKADENDDAAYVTLPIDGNSLVSFDSKKAVYVFQHEGWIITLTGSQARKGRTSHWAAY